MKRSGEDEVVESVMQYASVWKVLVGTIPGADLTDRPGLSIRWADADFPFWNAVFLTEQLADERVLNNRLEEASAFLREKGKVGLVYICHDFLSDAARERLPAAVAKEKLERVLPVYGMAGNILPLKTPIHPSLRIERVKDQAQLQAYADINSEAYEFPLEWARSGLLGSTFWKEVAYAYLGYEEGVPVSAACVVVNSGSLYLALVATRPPAQRKGFGEATVRHALQAAYEATGLKRTILHATDAGSPVYRRVGYQRTAEFLAYKRIDVL
jgi:GNAT superfamily N-acetyltransferase